MAALNKAVEKAALIRLRDVLASQTVKFDNERSTKKVALSIIQDKIDAIAEPEVNTQFLLPETFAHVRDAFVVLLTDILRQRRVGSGTHTKADLQKIRSLTSAIGGKKDGDAVGLPSGALIANRDAFVNRQVGHLQRRVGRAKKALLESSDLVAYLKVKSFDHLISLYEGGLVKDLSDADRATRLAYLRQGREQLGRDDGSRSSDASAASGSGDDEEVEMSDADKQRKAAEAFVARGGKPKSSVVDAASKAAEDAAKLREERTASLRKKSKGGKLSGAAEDEEVEMSDADKQRKAAQAFSKKRREKLEGKGRLRSRAADGAEDALVTDAASRAAAEAARKRSAEERAKEETEAEERAQYAIRKAARVIILEDIGKIEDSKFKHKSTKEAAISLGVPGAGYELQWQANMEPDYAGLTKKKFEEYRQEFVEELEARQRPSNAGHTMWRKSHHKDDIALIGGIEYREVAMAAAAVDDDTRSDVSGTESLAASSSRSGDGSGFSFEESVSSGGSVASDEGEKMHQDFEAAIRNNNYNTHPKTPYRGVGLKCGLIKGKKGEIEAFSIDEVFSNNDRFKSSSNKGESFDLTDGKNKITHVEVGDKMVKIKDLFAGKHVDTKGKSEKEIMEFVVSIFHAEPGNDVKFCLNNDVKQGVSCRVDGQSVYVTDECKAAKKYFKKQKGATGVKLDVVIEHDLEAATEIREGVVKEHRGMLERDDDASVTPSSSVASTASVHLPPKGRGKGMVMG